MKQQKAKKKDKILISVSILGRNLPCVVTSRLVSSATLLATVQHTTCTCNHKYGEQTDNKLNDMIAS